MLLRRSATVSPKPALPSVVLVGVVITERPTGSPRTSRGVNIRSSWLSSCHVPLPPCTLKSATVMTLSPGKGLISNMIARLDTNTNLGQSVARERSSADASVVQRHIGMESQFDLATAGLSLLDEALAKHQARGGSNARATICPCCCSKRKRRTRPRRWTHE